MTDIDELKRLAEAATPGPWAASVACDPQWAVKHGKNKYVCLTSQANDQSNAAFIAAANPQTVLALVARIKELETLCAILCKPRGDGNE